VEGGVSAALGRKKRPSECRALFRGAAVPGEACETQFSFSGKQLPACPAVTPWQTTATRNGPSVQGSKAPEVEAQPRGYGEGCRLTGIHRKCWCCKISDLRELEQGQY